ncbi:iron transporter [Candidatus Uhrbacteria bacterium CG10_big_fil_rev_8_21_14_0_10_48_11]|uniref:Iron transporter n=1 Tax=Candidatus Uhrbacteria bacterium CG10_big_fil_rev_8_21_14_0_10_48_11 TaxID=1975037 RepID=A0A2M8LFD5_9BACT|nr:MAG: iron transporter [Candidatus Uhrbacteria bacterium CG10_big_fil_rev_8_21_14_0_10_48_11]
MVKKRHHRIRLLFRRLGPGFITGASDDDPSGIATYAQTGAQFGYGQLWTAFFSTPFMVAMQEMSGRIGLVTGKGLAGVLREHFSRPLLYCSVVILLVANVINIGADLGAMAAALKLIVGLPLLLWLLFFVVLTVSLEIFIPYRRYARYLKYLTLFLLAYIFTGALVTSDWGQVLKAAVTPHISLSREYLLNIVALLGTTISPYLFFWQANEEVEEEVMHRTFRVRSLPKIGQKEVRSIGFDTIVGMLFSNAIMFFIILTAAATLGANGIHQVDSAAQAAEALRPLAGNFTYLLFALGIIGTGLLAIPVLAGSASYAVSETFGWRTGLYRRFRQAHGFYGIIALATVVGLLVNFLPITPFEMLYYTAVLNGVLAPPLMVVILLIANNKDIMGEYTNSFTSNLFGGIVTLVMFAATVLLFTA